MGSNRGKDTQEGGALYRVQVALVVGRGLMVTRMKGLKVETAPRPSKLQGAKTPLLVKNEWKYKY